MNTFGKIFRVSVFGESHGKSIGVIIDGCPAGLSLEEKSFEKDLERRKSGIKGTTSRTETDAPVIISGVFEGKTTGAPLTIFFENNNVRSSDYSFVRDTPRPGHADFTAALKFKGFNDYRGGGHFSGRLTIALVVAGVIARKIISPIEIFAELTEVKGNKDFEREIDAALSSGDSVGGIIECRATEMPIGLGEPFFDSVESYISHLAFSVPAIKGIEFGLGFESANRNGSEVNDEIIDISGRTASNNSGGINGGISNGNDLVFRVAVKPASSIPKPQQTLNLSTGKAEQLSVIGRHDACIALRAPVVIEAITAIALADLFLISRCYE